VGPGAREGVLRTFFAVEIPEASRRAAAALAERLRDEMAGGGPGDGGVRWVRPEGYHVTLRFLGDTPAARLDALAVAVRRETEGLVPFTLRLGALGALPDARRARVVVLEVEPREPLERLAAAVERGVVAAGFEPERRPFNGHLTLGRVRGRRTPLLRGGCEAPSFAVDAFVLFRSEATPEGSHYTPLERFALGGSASP
jgi:2'-5' RNA ligase